MYFDILVDNQFEGGFLGGVGVKHDIWKRIWWEVGMAVLEEVSYLELL